MQCGYWKCEAEATTTVTMSIASDRFPNATADTELCNLHVPFKGSALPALPSNIFCVINDRTRTVVSVFETPESALSTHNRLGNAGIYTIIRPMTGKG